MNILWSYLIIVCARSSYKIKFNYLNWCPSITVRFTQPHLYVVRGGGGNGLHTPWGINFPIWIIATCAGGARRCVEMVCMCRDHIEIVTCLSEKVICEVDTNKKMPDRLYSANYNSCLNNE